MKTHEKNMLAQNPHRKFANLLALLGTAILLSTTLSGCIVAGVSSSGHFFIWPGGLGILVILLVLFLLLRRR